MRLDNYLIEDNTSIDVNDINELIHKDCKKYLSLIHGKFPMYRGMYSRNLTGIKDVRKDRQPVGMSGNLAKIFNKFLKDSGHAVRSQSVMCTSDYEHSTEFGDPFWIFPCDPIKKYTWVDARDINIKFGATGWDSDTVEAWASVKDGRANDRDRFVLKKLIVPFEKNFHTNTGFDEAYSKRFEMWFECDKYYYIDNDIYGGWDKNKQGLIGLLK